MADAPILKNLKLWIDNYSKAGAGDQRAVNDFFICESTEAINSLRVELHAVHQGKVPTEVLDVLVGKPRMLKHKTYQEWARMMLLWLGEASKS